jgi:DNA modification methylase
MTRHRDAACLPMALSDAKGLDQLGARSASLPLRIATRLLRRYSPEGSEILLDPFCGKGSSLLAARLIGVEKAYGGDVAPDAVVFSRSRLTSVDLESLKAYLDGLRKRLQRSRSNPLIPSAVLAFLQRRVARDAIVVRRLIERDLKDKALFDVAATAQALLLSILHGHASYSLSLPCAHSFAMSAGYVRAYAKEHGLKRPRRDVLIAMHKKAQLCLPPVKPPKTLGSIKRCSAESISRLFRRLKGRVDVVLTSPPYLAAQTYAKDAWLRLWLLGFDYRVLHPSYFETGSVTRYRAETRVWVGECARLLRPDGRLIVVAGDVRAKSGGTRRIIRTGCLIADELAKSGDFRIDKTIVQRPANTRRYLHGVPSVRLVRPTVLRERVIVATRIKASP